MITPLLKISLAVQSANLSSFKVLEPDLRLRLLSFTTVRVIINLSNNFLKFDKILRFTFFFSRFYCLLNREGLIIEVI